MAEHTLSSFTEELVAKNWIYCTICKDILKPPVILIENVGNACFSCYEGKSEEIKKNNQKAIINSAVETVLSLLKLPCKFRTKGCEEGLSHIEMVNHQKHCKYRSELCPMFRYSGCDCECSTMDLLNHFKENHEDLILYESSKFSMNDKKLFILEISLTEELSLLKLLVMKNRLFILRMKINPTEETLSYFICHINNSSYTYSMKYKGNGSYYITTEAETLPDVHLYESFNEDVAVQVDLDVFRRATAFSDSIMNIFKIKIGDYANEGINKKMLHYFECPVCIHIMKPPIYQCQSGHDICNECKPSLEKCPTCRSLFGKARNYTLEGLTSQIQYPCVNLGCTEEFPYNKITTHERECPFKQYSCPIAGCSINGPRQVIISHMKEIHSDIVISSGILGFTESICFTTSSFNEQPKIKTRYVIAYNNIFKLVTRIINDVLVCAAQIIYGTSKNSNAFIYKVVIMNIGTPGRKLISTDYCFDGDISENELIAKCTLRLSTNLIQSYSALSYYNLQRSVTYQFMIEKK